jgi:hypothetical protein
MSNPPVMLAPQWLIDRMDSLRMMPRPPLGSAIKQLEASAKFRKANANRAGVEMKVATGFESRN